MQLDEDYSLDLFNGQLDVERLQDIGLRLRLMGDQFNRLQLFKRKVRHLQVHIEKIQAFWKMTLDKYSPPCCLGVVFGIVIVHTLMVRRGRRLGGNHVILATMSTPSTG